MTETAAVARVRRALEAARIGDVIRVFPAGTKTAADAAAAIGCTTAQIAKSIIFKACAAGAADRPVLVVASGINRVSKAKLAALIGGKITPAGPDFVLAATGFAAGGVSPLGHAGPLDIVIDRDLMALDPVWAAAGSPCHVFPMAPTVLARLTGGIVADIRQD